MENKNVRILIVEDEILIAQKICWDLERVGYEVYEPVATGAEAIACVAAQNPDILLVDIRLPGGMDGIQAVEEIRSRHNIPVIFMTGYSDATTIARAQQVKPAAFLEKPIFPHELEAAINAAIRSRE